MQHKYYAAFVSLLSDVCIQKTDLLCVMTSIDVLLNAVEIMYY